MSEPVLVETTGVHDIGLHRVLHIRYNLQIDYEHSRERKRLQKCDAWASPALQFLIFLSLSPGSPSDV